MDVLRRVLLASQTLAVHALIVDARDDAAAAFYRKYGFISFADERRLMLPMTTLRQLLTP
jgi:ribosomal protein S18 acetylase RimI-like enzyme